MSKLKKEWKLPKPEVISGENHWLPVVRVGRIIPFGYKEDPNDSMMLIPIPEQLELMEQAKKHLKKYSYRAVAAWLSEKTGRTISHVGLYQRVKSEYKRQTALANYSFYAEKYREAMEKIKRLEETRQGRRDDDQYYARAKENSPSDSQTSSD
jgi:hypothetical protein